MRRAFATLAAALFAAAALPHAAAGQSGIVGWDGKNPFACTLQELGTGTDFPEPKADPLCVEYDKRHQNVDKLGVVDFLSKEPARVAEAGPKCFYFQSDHWVGTVIEGNQQTQTYAWDGHYYYDKSKGRGGVYIENFTINGQTGDPTTVPGFPSQYKPYFGEGRGGVQSDDSVPVDPSCVAKAKQHDPYFHGGPGGGSGSRGIGHCRVPGGRAHRGIGGIRLHQRRRGVRRTLGAPTREGLRWVSYCMTGGGRLTATFSGRGNAARAILVLATAEPFSLHGIHPAERAHRFRKELRRFKRLTVHRNGAGIYVRRTKHELDVVGASRGDVKFVAVGRRSMSIRTLKRLLRTTPSWPRRRHR